MLNAAKDHAAKEQANAECCEVSSGLLLIVGQKRTRAANRERLFTVIATYPGLLSRARVWAALPVIFLASAGTLHLSPGSRVNEFP
jgi:hypothetical protein